MSKKYFFSLLFLGLLTISFLSIGKEVLAYEVYPWEYYCSGDIRRRKRTVCYFFAGERECYVQDEFVEDCSRLIYGSWQYYCSGNYRCKKRTVYKGYCSGGSCKSYSYTQYGDCTYCGSTSYSSWSYYCSGSSLYKKRTVYSRGCSGSSCYSNTSTQTEYVQNCGSTSYGSWSYYCSGSSLYKKRTVYNRGCSGSSCYSSTSTQTSYVENCGTGRWTNDYRCSGSWRQRRYVAEGCSNNQCYDISQWKNYTDCGTSSWTNNYQCSGVWIQRQKHNKGCSGSACYDNYSWVNDVDCSKICEGGTCTVGSVYCLCPFVPPYIESLSLDGAPDYCNTPEGIGRIGFKWIYKDANNDKQSHYHIHIATDSGFSNLVVDYVGAQTLPSGGTGTSAVKVKLSPTADIADLDVGFNDTYYWQMRVQAENGDWSDWKNGASFSTAVNPYPHSAFTWNPENPEPDEEVSFTNQTICYAEPCSFSWTFQNGNPSSSSEENPIVIFTSTAPPEQFNVTLDVTDSNTYSCPACTKTVTISEKLPLPVWKEIPPF